jgi:hypothetical protein
VIEKTSTAQADRLPSTDELAQSARPAVGGSSLYGLWCADRRESPALAARAQVATRRFAGR